MSLQLKPLSDVLGVEATGIDLSQPQSKETFQRLHRAWLESLVLVVRDQKISKEDQLSFARRFGEIQEIRSVKDDAQQTQNVMYVSNRVVDGSQGVLPEGEMVFHSDQCYYETPARASILNALELPSHGGETRFLNLYKAYENLPEDLKAQVQELEVYHQYDYYANPTQREYRVRPEAPHFVHPMVVLHPETDRPVLYVNRLMTHHVVGMEPEESDRFLQKLFALMEQPKFIYEHSWRKYDLLMWDNRAVLHARNDWDPNESRVLRRVSVQGKRPVAARNAVA